MMDPQHRLFLEVAWRAIENAGQSPEALQGKPIGVFVGVQFNDYQNKLFDNHQTNFYIATGNSHALIANRLSHVLDLSGPSESIDTACSSALVAINRAVNAIKLGECESAIVGATTCILNPMSYVVTSQLGIISPEGRSKVFDANADGYVKGEGVGVLWLMPLKMAKDLNYPIHGLIKGIGVNHGGKSTSLTAPNIKAQQQLLVDTYQKASVAMDSISFIETHGTGTLLGDSVEIESIKAASLELSRLNPENSTTFDCFLGAVKSNAGHLEPAAGMIGVIKVLLMFKHATKVKNLHMNMLSPYIKLENTRFKLQEQKEAWVSCLGNDGKLLTKRAGVSSFGFGGTNAHVILEEYIQPPLQQHDNKPYYLCTLSAKAESSLLERIHALEQFLMHHPLESIEDISYTLNVGRSHYPYRCAIVAESVSVLATALSLVGTKERGKNIHFSSEMSTEAPSNLHQGMLEYLQNELIKTISEPESYFKQLNNLAALYTLQLGLNWELIHANESRRRVSLPSYPFLKTKHWVALENGANENAPLLRPKNVLAKNLSTFHLYRFELDLDVNHSYFSDHKVNGQPVLPGVLVLEVVYQAIQCIFPHQSSWLIKEIHWLQPINAAILQQKLYIHLKPSPQGLHFELVDPDAVTIFAKGAIEYSNHQSPHESINLDTLTARFTEEHQGQDIYKQFAAKGIDYGITFQAIIHAYSCENEVLAEIRPPKDTSPSPHSWGFYPSFIDAALQSSIVLFESLTMGSYLYALEEVCLLKELSMQSTYFAHLQKASDGSISLKLYDNKGGLCVSIAKMVIKTESKTVSPLSCLKTLWIESPLAMAPIAQNRLEKNIGTVIITTDGSQEKTLGDAIISLSPEAKVMALEWSKMCELFQYEKQPDIKDIYIIFNEPFALSDMAVAMTRCTSELLLFFNYLGKQKYQSDLHLRFITINAHFEKTARKSSPIAMALTGLVHSFHQEILHIHVSCMDISMQTLASVALVEMIKNEPKQSHSTLVAIDEHAKRLVRLFSLHTFPALDLMSYRRRGVYLVVGGAHGVGFEWSQFLARHYQALLIWVGRSPEEKQVSNIRKVSELGGRAQYYQADVGDIKAMTLVFDQIYKEHGLINGVIHSALVLDDKPMDKVDLSSIERVLRPKVLGTINLLMLLKDIALDFLIIFSSAQSYMNNSGQSTYAAASIFQDELAKQFRSEVNYPIKVVNWGYWGQTGAAATVYHQRQMQQKGILCIEPNEAFRMLEQFVMSSMDDCVLLSATPAVIQMLTTIQPLPEEFNEGFLALEQLSAQLLFSSFKQQGYFNGDVLSYRLTDLMESLAIKPQYQPLFMSVLSIFDKEKWIYFDKTEALIYCNAATRPPQMHASDLIDRYPLLRAHIELVSRCTSSLFMILNGQVRHTQVLFPNNQFQFLEQVYSSHPISQATTQQLIEMIIMAVREGHQKNPSAGFNLLEVGAGTGSVSAEVLQVLRENHLKITYIFTDISEGFLQQARSNPRLQDDAIQLKRLDISHDPQTQGFEPHSIDLVLANNVIHATGCIAQSLEHIKCLLKNDGIILLNELTQNSYFLTATFGLTPEWWKTDPKEQTIVDSPLLSLSNWKKVLASLNYSNIQTPLLSEMKRQASLCEAQQIIIATNKTGKVAMDSIMHLEKYLKTIFSDLLRVPVSEINNHSNLGDYGLDSLVTLEATERLKKVFKQFSNTVLFEHGTVEKLIYYLSENYSAEVGHLFESSEDRTRSIAHPQILGEECRVSKASRAHHIKTSDIAVIGYHGRFPGADTVDELWDLLLHQKTAITEIPADRPLLSSTLVRGGFLKSVEAFDALFFNISPREALKMDPQERLFLETCWELLERAGYTKADLSQDSLTVGTFVGAMNTDYSVYSNYSALWSIANRVSYFFNLTGPSLTIDTACASSLTAIHMACQSLRQDESQLAIAGGVNLILHPNHFAMLEETQMLSKKQHCLPFSDDADGMIIGEGSGVLLLKPLLDAIRDKDKIHAVIKGSHVNSSGKTKGYMVPNPRIQEALMNKALDRAEIDVSTVSYIETQGTGTKLGDEIELEALQRVYGKCKPVIGTLKPNLGHLESAAGVAGIIKILLQMEHKTLVPAIGGKTINQSVLLKNSPFSLPEQQVAWQTQEGQPRRAAISAFGAGGSNAHIILEEFPKDPKGS